MTEGQTPQRTCLRKGRSRKQGLVYALVGLSLGILLGMGKILIESAVEDLLVELLNDEAKKACQCEFQADSVQFSLLQLKGTAKNARVVRNGVSQILVPRLTARFNPLSKLAQKRIAITSLNLFHPVITGVGPESGGFQFINKLAKPLTEEQKQQWKIRIKLMQLDVINGEFTENINGGRLSGTGVGLTLIRDAQDNLSLTPSAKNLRYQSDTNDEGFSVGQLKSSLYVTDDDVTIEDIALRLGKSLLKYKGVVEKNGKQRISGTSIVHLHGEDIPLDIWRKGAITGETMVSGSLDDLRSTTSFHSAPEDPLSLFIADTTYEPITVSTTLTYDSATPLSLAPIAVSFPTGNITSNKGFQLQDGNLVGDLSISFQELNLPHMKLLNGELYLEISSKDQKNTAQLSGTIGGTLFQSMLIPAININLQSIEDRLLFHLTHGPSNIGDVRITGEISSLSHKPVLENSQFHVSNLILWDIEKPFSLKTDPLFTVSAAGKLAGPLQIEKLKGNAELTFSSKAFKGESALRGEVSLKDGAIQGTVTNDTSSFLLSTAVDFLHEGKGLVELTLKDFQPKQYLPDLDCIKIGLDGNYTFLTSDPLHGEGALNLQSLHLGCRPYQTRLLEPRTLPFKHGTLSLDHIGLGSESSSLEIYGSASSENLNIHAAGSILLKSFLPLVPFLDDLSGEILVEASVEGPPGLPKFNGVTHIRHGGVAVESQDILIQELTGDLTFSSEGIKLNDLVCTANGGKATIHGTVNTKDILSSRITVTFSDILYQPNADSFASFSGDISLAQSESGSPLLKGNINIENAEFLQEFDIRDFVSRIPSFLFGGPKSKQISLHSLPELGLDLSMQSKGNIFIITSFFGIEVGGKIAINGNLNTPTVSGSLSSRRGWLGFNETRFEINSGSISFRPPSLIPQLSVLGETFATSSRGQNTLITLEVTGSLIRPLVHLASDQGLSEREILDLLGTRSDFRFPSGRPQGVNALELPHNSQYRRSQTLLGRIIHQLTRIDTVSLEPKFNAHRGQLEPAFIAQKHLLPKLDLLAESFLGRPEDGSQLFLQYQLTKRAQLIGSLDTVTAESQSSLGADISYTVLSSDSDFVTYRFHGMKFFRPKEILQKQRLSNNSQISEIELQKIADSLQEHYRSEGFFHADISATCKTQDELCRHINITVREGARAKIRSYKSTGDPLPKEVLTKLQKIVELQSYATSSLREDLHQQLISSLRSDGFLQARSRLTYTPLSSTDTLKPHHVPYQILIEFHRGNAVSLAFEGNTKFSSRDFLDTINLFTRKQPFGNNTIHILARNIERLYRENGYLYATVGVQEQQSPSKDRKLFRLSIEEEHPVQVSQVVFEGLFTVSLEELEEQFSEEKAKNTFHELLHPHYAVQEEVERNERQIERMLNLLGFPTAIANGEIIPQDKEDAVLIRYEITEGQRELSQSLVVQDFPSNIDMPAAPNGPYSIVKANRYVEELLYALESAGYLHASLWSEMEAKSILVHVDPGEKEHIAEVIIRGNSNVSKEVILQNFALQPDSVWNSENVRRARTQILSLGLFSRVHIARTVNKEGKSIVIVTVLERPLQTLELGSGVNSTFGLHLFGKATERGFFLDGRHVSLRFDTFYDDTQAQLSRGIAGLRYTNPRFSFSDFHHTEDLRFEKLDLSTQEFNLNRTSFASALSKSFDHFSYGFSHTIFSEFLSDVASDAVLDPTLDTGAVRLSILSASTSYDARDNPLTPFKGYNLGTELRLSSRAIGSDANYASFTSRASYLQPFSLQERRFGIATSARTGIALGFRGTNDIPISQRYYLGGRTTLRGFSENSLGPQGENGAVIGGDFSIAINNELRYFPTDAFSLHLFFDSGSVFLRDRGISSEDIRESAGTGFRYLSPIGPIGFDIGVPLDRRHDESAFRVHFSIGSIF